METIAGLQATGRKLVGPASDLVELTAENGLRHTAIVFHPEYRGHNALNSALEVVKSFLESPMVTGLVELVGHDGDHGAFVYPTGETWSVAEVIRLLADLGEAGGVRAGLELMYAAGQILVEAADIGENAGVYSHGGLTPWRIMLKRDGQVLVIGHALPQAEILQFHEDNSRVPREDSFRYCPPERMEAAAEDVSSDLFGLSLIAFELMTGKPVYDGLVNDIRQQAARGEGSRRLFRFKDVLPGGVRDLLARALKPAAEDRFEDGEDFLEAVRAILSSAEATGPSLMELMARVAAQGQRTGKALQGGKTQMLSKDELKRMLDDDPNNDQVAAAGAEGRSAGKAWSPPPDRRGRRPRRSSAEDAEPEADEASAPAAPTPPATDEDDDEDGVKKWSKVARRPRRASPTSSEGDDEPVAPPATPSPSPPPESAAALETSGSKAADLLARIRASADDPSTSGVRAREESRRNAANVIQSILSSSSGRKGGGLEDRVREARERVTGDDGPPEEEASGTDDAPRFQAGRARRPRRSGESEDVPPPPRPPRPAAPEDLAEPEETAAPVAPVPVGEPVGEPASVAAPAPSVPEPEPEPEPELQPVPELQPSAPAPVAESTPVSPSNVVPAGTAAVPVDVPAVVAPDLPAAAARVAGATAFVGADLSRPPDPIRSLAGKDGSALYTIRRGEGGRTVRMRLPVGASAAEAVAWLVGNVVPVRTDLSGNISGWYRLANDAGPIPPSMSMRELDPSETLTLRFVPNTVVHADIEVVGGPAPVRMVSPVGTAVPAVTLLDHLCAWLSLPAGRWQLLCEGTPLEAHGILADVRAPGGGLVHLSVQEEPEGA